jgi:hypothetical protein
MPRHEALRLFEMRCDLGLDRTFRVSRSPEDLTGSVRGRGTLVLELWQERARDVIASIEEP